ncbi:polysaccharide transporter, PST family [Raineyella antarctica]|uniref:Polysaccharide transporter, PST family n=2 Tax=Raineyella antarctica TaxID=1577474 RepID=A0A1G6HGS2_9ACTN|nr:polysaccharide transporter, PST family [Raineyella antarctica]
MRLGTFAVGIFLARMFSHEEFGVYAVVLTVQAVLMTVADFGLSTDLIRSGDHTRKAPTVATLSLGISAVLTAITMAVAAELAASVGAPGGGPVLAVMSLTLLIAGVGVVPYATLQREFRQRELFLISVVDFAVGTALTLVLILAGLGVMSLAVSRVAAQSIAVILQYRFVGERPRLGFDRSVARGVVAFGLPVAGANLLSWALLGADKMLLSGMAGAAALGVYFLAFNIANWPMSALGQVVRSVSLPTFSRVSDATGDRALGIAWGPVWSISVLAGLLLTVLASPAVQLLYGTRWLEAAPLLMILGAFGALRTVLDLATTYLLARGYSTRVLWLQLGWMVILVPGLVLGIRTAGAVGAALAQVTAGALLLLLYGISLARVGTDIRAVWASFWPPLAAAVVAAPAAWACTLIAHRPLVDLLVGGVVGTAVYTALLWRWFRGRLNEARRLGSAHTATLGTEPPGSPSVIGRTVQGGPHHEA